MTKKECLYKKIFGRNKYASKLCKELTNSARYKYSRNFRACNGTDSRLTAGGSLLALVPRSGPILLAIAQIPYLILNETLRI